MTLRTFGVIVPLVAAALTGCAAKPPSTFSVPAGDYNLAFETARDVLRDRRFPVERIDADQGVITTSAKSSSGFATPWDMDQTTLSQEFSDLVNYQSRRVRVSFENADGSAVLDHAGPAVGRVDVVVYRTQDYTLRPASRALLYSTRSVDPNMTARGIPSQYEVPSQEDTLLADRLAREIERGMTKARNRATAAATSNPAPISTQTPPDVPAEGPVDSQPVPVDQVPVEEAPAVPPAGPAGR